MFEKAMDKLRDEMAKNAGDEGISYLGEYLTARLRAAPEIAGKLLEKRKSIAGAFGAVRDYARKNQKNSFCAVSDAKACEIACGYFGIETQAPANTPLPLREISAPTDRGGNTALDLDALLEG